VALSTRIIRPSRLEPLSALIALSASSAVAISTNPKPRERPVSRSVITIAEFTGPNRANASRSPSLAVENERPPTNSFTDMRALLSSSLEPYLLVLRAYHHGCQGRRCGGIT